MPPPRPPVSSTLAALAVCALLPACNGLFYHPNDSVYRVVAADSSVPEDVWFDSADGTRLHGWFLRARGEPRGTVVQYHGNGANLTAHVGLVDWLPAAGYDVLLFDYRGYGRSEGAAGREGVHADAQAALRYVRSREDVDPDRILALGQSLGGAVCLAALGEGDRTGVRGIAVDSTFLEYRSVANSQLGGTFLTYPLTWLLISGDHDPADSIGELAGIPLLVMHGDADRQVPLSEGEAVFAAAGEPKEFVRHEGGGHIRYLQTDAGRRRLLQFFERCLGAGL